MEYVFAAIWVLCGLLFYGLSFAWYQRNWPTLAKDDYWEDMAICGFLALLGPLILAGFLIYTLGRPKKLQGFKWK